MGDWRQVLPRVAELLAGGLEDGLHRGVQGAVCLEGETVAEISMGEAAPGLAMTTGTVVQWLSSGKPLGAVAIAQLWERGRLELDDPVCKYVEEFAQGGKEAVTIRHLLTHTAGLRMLEEEFRGFTWEAAVAAVCATPLEPDWPLGDKAGYHRMSSWFILGEIVRRIDGRDYARYVQEMIFAPLSMRDCYLSLPPEVLAAGSPPIGVLWNTQKKPPVVLTRMTPESLARCSPGSSARGPIRELARFYEALRVRTTGAEALLRPQTIEALTARHRVGLQDHTFRHPMDWGLGFILQGNRHGADTVPYGYGRHATPRAFGHGGAQSSVGFCDPPHHLVVALMMNGMPGEPRHQRRVRSVLTALYEDLGLEA
jgi:CubicO group peptidase (beta-lactamase class C family)